MSEEKKPRRGMRLLTRAVLVFALTTPLVRLSAELTVRPRTSAPFMLLAVAHEFDRVAEWTGHRVCALGTETVARDASLRFAVYTSEGHLRSSAGETRLPPLEGEAKAQLEASGFVRLSDGAAVRCDDGRSYAVIEARREPVTAGEVARFVIVAYAIVGAVAYLFVRTVVRPLHDLVATSERLGSGDLNARADDSRGDELGDLARAFNTMAERLERAVRAEREMIGNIGHELRTPLARMRVVVEWAQSDPDRAQTLLVEVERDMRELERLIDHVLEAQRLSAGPTTLAPTAFRPHKVDQDLRAIVREAVDAARATHADRPIELGEGTPILVTADGPLVRRAIANLLENAIRYSSDEVVVTVDASTPGVVSVRVRDRGVGISVEDQKSLFTPFFRVDKSRGRRTGGTGLGLVIVKRILELHAGSVAIVSAVDVGTEVTVTLPLAGGLPKVAS
jgi:signal transduction histidine kinase